MEGILIVAHGSRAVETEKTLTSICAQVKELLPDRVIKIGFMEFSKNTIAAGLDELVKEGIQQIKVIPYFLFAGIHIKEDIPKELEDYMEKNPAVKITMGRTLGDDSHLCKIIKDRIEEC